MDQREQRNTINARSWEVDRYDKESMGVGGGCEVITITGVRQSGMGRPFECGLVVHECMRLNKLARRFPGPVT